MSYATELQPLPAGEPSTSLTARWQQFRHDNPRVRIRDAARELGVSEAQLVATGCGKTVIRLAADWPRLIAELPHLGPVMALTRNQHAVHEKTGSYARLTYSGSMGTLLGQIDLRLFFSRWHYGFSVQEDTARGVRHSLQFFDQLGTAIHKIYLTDDSDQQAFYALVEKYRSPEQDTAQPVLPMAPALPESPDDRIDVAGLTAHWQALQDTHDFNDLLNRFGAKRLQALRLVGKQMACSVGATAPRRLLNWLAAEGTEIMLFVANAGVVQIHIGPVINLKALGGWFNVLDEGFSLHLREDAIASAWVVRKPTRDRVISSLEVFGSNGELICQIFGRRKPGQTEDPHWRGALEGICDVEPT